MGVPRKMSVAAGILGLTMPVLAQNTWTIPGTVNVSGLNGTKFVSDVAITNPGTAPALASLTPVPANGAAPATMLLSPGQTIVTHNILQQLWGVTGAAATRVTGLSDLLIRARTYNTAASGTYGVALPVVADGALLDASAPADSLWVSQSADSNSGYRTNVAVIFPDPDGGAATVTVFDADGAKVGSQDFSLASAGFQQFGVAGFAGNVAVGRAEIQVTRGRAAGYSVVVDNVTGDSSLFSFETLPAGGQDVLVNGVARAGGRNNTFFRTDARFYNPGATDATITVAFHANQNANPSPATATFTVPAGKIRDVVDVLDTLLGLPVGSAGALHFTSGAPVAILCRTSNVDPTGVKPGTYGAQQKPTPLLSFVMSADAGAAVTGIRQNNAFRTNIGFAAGADGAQYTLTLQAASGTTAATSSGSLGPWGWTQPNVQDLFPGAPVPDDATLLLKVTSGSVDVFDSSIDNASGDPVVTPIIPLPVNIPSSATIGPQGGSVRSDDGRLTLRIPAGALASGTAVSITANANAAPNGVGSGYTLTPGGLAFAKPAWLTLTYTPFDLLGSGVDALGLAYLSGSTWFGAPFASIDTLQRTLTIPVSSAAPSLVAGRTRLAGSSVQWSPYVTFRITPPQVFMFTSGDKMFYLQAVSGTGPTTSPVPLGPPSTPAGLDFNWYANGKLIPLANTGILTPSLDGTSAGYHAPACIPLLDPVTIAVQMIDKADRTQVKFVSAKAYVLDRDWKLNVDWFWQMTCDNTANHGASWGFGGTQDVTFTLDDGFVIGNPDPLTAQPEKIVPAKCPGIPTCNATGTMGPFATVRISDVTGGIDNKGVLHAVVHYTEPDIPAASLTGCLGQQGGVLELETFHAGRVIEYEAKFPLDRWPVLHVFKDDVAFGGGSLREDYVLTSKTPVCQ